MSSLARKQRRGKVDQFGNTIPKRPFNNRKRTKGRKTQSDMQFHTSELTKRIKYVIELAKKIKEAGLKTNKDNFGKIVRQFDKDNMFDEYEQMIIHEVTNDE
tara:strand:+ start:7634 stop:7939 length:306 start_codon:yes stop_codon:yes gene_type:complete